DYVFSPTVSGQYWASVTHTADGCISHSANYVVNVCAPTISQQPANALRISPAPATLSVTASAEATAYQWYVGLPGDITTPIAGATARQVNVSPATDTSYWVRVIGSCGKDDRGLDIGAVDSTAALVTVCQPPSI